MELVKNGGCGGGSKSKGDYLNDSIKNYLKKIVNEVPATQK